MPRRRLNPARWAFILLLVMTPPFAGTGRASVDPLPTPHPAVSPSSPPSAGSGEFATFSPPRQTRHGNVLCRASYSVDKRGRVCLTPRSHCSLSDLVVGHRPSNADCIMDTVTITQFNWLQQPAYGFYLVNLSANPLKIPLSKNEHSTRNSPICRLDIERSRLCIILLVGMPISQESGRRRDSRRCGLLQQFDRPCFSGRHRLPSASCYLD